MERAVKLFNTRDNRYGDAGLEEVWDERKETRDPGGL